MADPILSTEFVEGITRDQLLSLIRDPKADPTLLEHIVSQPVVDEELWRLVLHHRAATPAAMAKIARAATLPILKELTGDRALLGRSPQIPYAILDNPAATEDEIAVAEAVLRQQAHGATEEETKKSLFAIIKEMTVGQKLTLAKKGNKDARLILIKDPNEIVALDVVRGPRITDTEILGFAQMRDVSEKVLREIANLKRYRKNKLVILALLNNPKTPVGVFLDLGITNLTENELKGLARNRNVPAAVSRAAQQVLDRRKKAAGGAPGGGH